MHIFGKKEPKTPQDGAIQNLLKENLQLKSERSSFGILICQLIKERGGTFTYDKESLVAKKPWGFKTSQSEDGKQVTITIEEKSEEVEK